jgi:hypothetical protein
VPICKTAANAATIMSLVKCSSPWTSRWANDIANPSPRHRNVIVRQKLSLRAAVMVYCNARKPA